ncbi:hypothetical protein PAPYR_10218 [Paratrimastix pyriformis]|uniref:Uncharacterized protein n=1 Tax=Paratrimastix pyriformis TaxID=342808 RepID=A0ABQ8U919_9EUKA|nr:hypothetical protein PAPYR_10218 [Paratrimastix pyriformis]
MKLIDLHHQNRYRDVCRGTKIHTGDELDRLEPVPHPPKKPLSIARVRSARTPEMGRGLPGDQLPLGAGLMTPYLELIRQTFDGLFRPSSPDSAGKDLLLDIGGEDEPNASPRLRPAATHAPGAPLPRPYRPEARPP